MLKIPTPIILKLEYQELKQLTLKPLTAGIYFRITSHAGEVGDEALSMEKLVAFLLTEKSKENVMGLDMEVRTLEERLEFLLPANKQGEIYDAVAEAWARGGMGSPKGLPLRRRQLKVFTLKRLTIWLVRCTFLLGAGWGLWKIFQWIFLNFI